MKLSCSKEDEGEKEDLEELLACTEMEFSESVEAEKKKIGWGEEEKVGNRECYLYV